MIELPPAEAALLPMADRIPRGEVVMKKWALSRVQSFVLPEGSTRLTIRGGEGLGLSVKGVRLGLAERR